VIIPRVLYLVCHSLSNKFSHTTYNRNDDCGKKSREASSKISGSEVTFVHNCIGSSNGKKSATASEQIKLYDSKISKH